MNVRHPNRTEPEHAQDRADANGPHGATCVVCCPVDRRQSLARRADIAVAGSEVAAR